jgi:hypothetical protein
MRGGVPRQESCLSQLCVTGAAGSSCHRMAGQWVPGKDIPGHGETLTPRLLQPLHLQPL